MDCVIDRLRAYIQERRGWLGGKTAILEPLAHRTHTELSRAHDGPGRGTGSLPVGPEGRPAETGESHHRRHTTLPNDLLYLRVRLLTTRIAITASNRCKQLSDLDAEQAALLPDVERLKTEFAP